MSDVSKILSQDDIDALLSAGVAAGDSLILSYNGHRFPKDQKVKVFSYDPVAPVFLTGLVFDRFREFVLHFMDALTRRFAVFLKLDLKFNLGDIRTVSYKFATESFTPPVFIGVVKLEPLIGVSLVGIPARMAMAMVERMLGGAGSLPEQGRSLTSIEAVLAEDIVKIVAEEWMHTWSTVHAFTPALVGTENFPAFLKTSSPDTVILVLTIPITLGDATEVLHFAIPYTLFEPVLTAMESAAGKFAEALKPDSPVQPDPTRYADLSVPVEAWWKASSIWVNDLLQLRVGDVVELSSDLLNEVEVRIGTQKHFKGSAGVHNDHVAVELTQTL